jgi:GNAT superfamily N-acetyltransferase
MIHVRPYVSTNREFVISLAPRLAIGIPSWRDPHKMIETAQSWMSGTIEQHGNKTIVFVAENETGERLGFATVSHSTHLTGEGQAYIGELATSEEAESRGVGKALVWACEQWARNQGYRLLSLATGAAHERALGFYRCMGYLDEDITLVKLLWQNRFVRNANYAPVWPLCC